MENTNNKAIKVITGTEILNNENKIAPYLITDSVTIINNVYSKIVDMEYYSENKTKKYRRKPTNLKPKKKRRK